MVKLQVENLIYWYKTESLLKEALNGDANTRMLCAEIVYDTKQNELVKNRCGMEYLVDCATQFDRKVF